MKRFHPWCVGITPRLSVVVRRYGQRNEQSAIALTIKAMESVMPRELTEPHKGDKRYVRRGKKGEFTSRQVAVGRSLSADRRSKAKTIAKKGEGDRGDRRS
jgi:hypothetical protein